MDASQVELEVENKKLRTQVTAFQTELDQLRVEIQALISENELLRRDLRRQIEERSTGLPPSGLANLGSDALFEAQRKQITSLEQEKSDLEQLYQESRQMILQLSEEIDDLKHPLKPHLIKLDMQSKQV
jgi:regulator of replication initiation timing